MSGYIVRVPGGPLLPTSSSSSSSSSSSRSLYPLAHRTALIGADFDARFETLVKALSLPEKRSEATTALYNMGTICFTQFPSTHPEFQLSCINASHCFFALMARDPQNPLYVQTATRVVQEIAAPINTLMHICDTMPQGPLTTQSPTNRTAVEALCTQIHNIPYERLSPEPKKAVIRSLLETGDQLLAKGMANEAAIFFHKVVALDRHNQAALLLMGLSLFLLSNTDSGVCYVKYALSTHPDAPAASILLAFSHAMEAQNITDTDSESQTKKTTHFDAAIESLKPLIERYTDDVCGFFNALAILNVCSLDAFKGERCRSAHLEIEKIIQRTQYSYAENLFAQGEKWKAFHFVLACGNHWFSRFRMDPNRISEVMPFLSACLTMNPTHQETLAQLAICHLTLCNHSVGEEKTKHLKAAEKYLSQLLALPVHNLKITNDLAQDCLRLGYPFHAQQILLRCLNIFKVSQHLVASLFKSRENS